jgi:hypothetical protein
MNKKQSKHGLARVWPALGVVAIVAAGLTGVSGAWAADASAAPAKPPETPAVAADETVVLDDAMIWRIYRVEGPQHIRAADGKLLAGWIRHFAGSNHAPDGEGVNCRHTQQQNPPAGGASTSGFCGNTSILPPADWASPAMDDGAWPRFRLPQPALFAQSGPNQTMNLGGDVYDTVLLLARTRFEVKDPAQVKSCRLSLIYWGGVVVYVNGKEVARGSLPGQTSDWGEPAEDYPEEAFLTPEGKVLTIDDEKNPDRLEKRQRRLTNVTIPAAALRGGVNVIAIEAHPAPVNAKVLKRGYAYNQGWTTVGLLRARLTVSPAGAAKQPRPGGVQVWNIPTSDKVNVFDVGNPLDPLQPLVIRAARNTVFSSRLMVGSDQPIKGLKVNVGDLGLVTAGVDPGHPSKTSAGGPASTPAVSGTAKIPSSAVRVRYAVPATPDKSWLSPNDFDGLFDAIPAEIPVSQGVPGWDRSPKCDIYSGTAGWFYHFRTDHPALKGRAVVPLWFTVKVPREVPAGVYEGQVSVSAEGLAEVKVPLRVHVSAYTAPDVRDYCVQNYLFQSEESVMNYYGVPPYSDKHLDLVGKSLALAADLNCLHVEANLVIGYQSGGTGGGEGNPESLVRWVKQPDGTFKHDFTNFDRYLDMVAKAVGTPRVLALNHFTKYDPKVSCLDPATGKITALDTPKDLAGAYAFWKPVYDEIRKKLKARGWLEQTTLGAQLQNSLPGPGEVFLGNKLWPGAEWSFTCHRMAAEFIGAAPADLNDIFAKIANLDLGKVQAAVRVLKEGGNADKELQAAGLTAAQVNWAPVRHSDYTQGNGRHTDTKRPLYLGPRHDATAFNPRTAFWGCGENLPEVRRLVEAVVYQKGVDGVGEQGVDLFPLKTKLGGYGHSPTKPGTHWPNYDPYMRALLYPGPDGPVATERFEMFREGLQLMEIRMFLERAVAEKKVNPELWKRAAAVLAERPVKSSGQLNSFFYRCFQSEADAKLLNMAGEVAGDLPFAANTPASELAVVVEQVAAKPADAENRKQVRRLRSVTSALTPAQLGRLYGCLKTESKARFELTELVTVLGRAFGVRCGGDEGKLGQVLGDAEALPFLRGYVQAAAESTNATLKAWARTDGAILLPLANGLRAQYYRGGERWEDKDLAAERLVERIVTPDQTLGLPGFEFGENKRVSIAVRWTGFIDVKTPGKYTVYALADDGARLWVDDTLLTESYKSNDGVTVELAAGLHPLKVEYWKHSGKCSLAVTWSGPGFERQPIGAEALRTPAVEQKK